MTTLTVLFAVADWINSISAIAALLAAIATLMTVREIRKQREHSYHPDINISNFEFYVYKYDKDEDDEAYFFSLYYSTKQLLEADRKKIGYNELTIDISNIGLAVAKQVSWQWKVNFSEIKKVLESGERDFATCVISDDQISVSSTQLEVDWFYFVCEENHGGFFNFILPYSIENRNNEIRIPQSFLDLYWLYKAKGLLIEDDEMEYPPLHLIVKYTNMHGKEIQKIFLLYLSWSFLGNPLGEQTELAKFRIEIMEPNI